MSSSLQRKLTFFRDCLDAETQAQSLWNIRNSKSQLVKEFSIDLTSNGLRLISTDRSYALSVQAVLERYGREKQLLVGRFFIVANHTITSFGGSSRQRKICCPIIYAPCELETGVMGKTARIFPILNRSHINPAAKKFFAHFGVDAESKLEQLLNALRQVSDQSQLESEQEDSSEIINNMLSSLKASLEKADDNLTVLLGRNLNTKDTVKRLKKDQVYLIDQVVSYVQRKQTSAQGSLHEIEKMVQHDDSSKSLEAILNQNADHDNHFSE